MNEIFNIFLHLDQVLGDAIAQFGNWTYVVLWIVIFCETGFVFTPFLPGDSLLFAAGTFAALDSLDPVLLFVILSVAAILGDTVNYWIGRSLGLRVLRSNAAKMFRVKEAHIEKTQKFYERYGGKTIILARFVPIVRTFAPFIAGVGQMHYGRFLAYNVGGGIVWVGLFMGAGYFFGNIPFVRDNFTMAIFAIIFVSLLPGLIEFARARSTKTNIPA